MWFVEFVKDLSKEFVKELVNDVKYYFDWEFKDDVKFFWIRFVFFCV